MARMYTQPPTGALRVIHIALEVIWLLLGLVCLGIGIYIQSKGQPALMFFILSAVAFAMGWFRMHMRRRRERQARLVKEGGGKAPR